MSNLSAGACLFTQSKRPHDTTDVSLFCIKIIFFVFVFCHFPFVQIFPRLHMDIKIVSRDEYYRTNSALPMSTQFGQLFNQTWTTQKWLIGLHIFICMFATKCKFSNHEIASKTMVNRTSRTYAIISNFTIFFPHLRNPHRGWNVNGKSHANCSRYGSDKSYLTKWTQIHCASVREIIGVRVCTQTLV